MALRFWGTAGGDERNEYLLSDVGAVDFYCRKVVFLT